MNPDAMRILMYSRSPVAGVPIVLRDCINKYTSHSCKALMGGPGYRDGRRWGPPDALLRDVRAAAALIAEADVIMIHNGTVDRGLRRTMAGKRLLCYYHSEPHRVNHDLERQGFPCYVIAQGHALMYPSMAVLPNVVDIEYEALQPDQERSTPFKLGFAPSNRNSHKFELARKNKFSSKGWPEVEAALRELKKQGVEVHIFEGIPYERCLAERRKLHFMLDEVVTGSYHRCTLEASAQGQVAINALDPRVEEIVTKVANGVPPPWLKTTPGNMFGEVIQLLSNPDELGLRMGASRKWMEDNWHPKDLLERFYIPAFRSARKA